MHRGSWSGGVVLVLVMVAGSARADVYASGYLVVARTATETSKETATELGPGFQGEVGLRLGRTAGLAFHAGIARASYEESELRLTGNDVRRASYMALDFGVGVHVVAFRRVTLGGWLGSQDALRSDACRTSAPRPGSMPETICSKSMYRGIHQPEVGFTVAVDLFKGHPHRTSAFASISHGLGADVDDDDDDFSITSNSVAIGIGYRYW